MQAAGYAKGFSVLRGAMVGQADRVNPKAQHRFGLPCAMPRRQVLVWLSV